MSDALTIRYNNSFTKVVDAIKVKSDMTVKVFQAPQGFGKTHNLILEWIPYLFATTKTQVVVITAPLSDIVSDNTFKLKSAGLKHGFIGTTDIAEALKFMKGGMKVVLYVTNQMLFATDSDMPNLLKEEIKKTNFAIIDDEFHAWSASSSENYKEVLGHHGGKFKASMYNTLAEFAPYTNYLFGITATPNIEVQGLIDTYGKLNYELVNKDSVILPQELRDRSAWMGQVFWRTNISKLIDRAIEDAEYVEKSTGFKRVTMIVSEQNKSTDSWTIDDTLDYIQPRIPYTEKHDEFQIAVTSVHGCYLYTKNGDRKKTTDEEILIFANDLDNPLRYILVVDKFRMGINCNPLKGLVMLKSTDSKRSDGSAVLEGGLQMCGRLLRPYAGISGQEFWEDYEGSLEKCPTFPKEINKMNYYMMDTPMWRAVMQEFEENIAPNYCDIDLCPYCGANLSASAMETEDKIKLRLNEEFGI